MIELKEICKVQCGFAFDSKKFTEDSSYYPLIRIRDVKRGFTQTYYTGEFSSEYIVHKGDLLVGMDGEFNIARWNSDDALLNQRVCRIITNNNTNEEYLRFYLKRTLKLIESKTSFVTVKHLSAKELNSLKLNLPCIEDQQRISKQLSTLELMIRKNKQVLELLDELVKARFMEMFGDPIQNSKGYPIRQFSDYIISLTSGSRGWAKYCVDDGKEWFITIKNVKDCHIITDNIQPIDAPSNAEAKRTKVEEGDLLISITADLGRTGVVTKEVAEHGAYINQHLSCIRIDREILNPLYVAYYMESPAGKGQFMQKNQSAVKAGLNFNSINSLKLLVPPMEEQNKFIRFVKQIDKSRSRIQKSLEASQELFDSLMQEYFG